MTRTVERTTATGVAIHVTVPYGDIRPLLPKAAERISNDVEIEGFRKGKAPFDVIKQKVGEFKILEEAARIYIEKQFPKLLEDIESEEYKGKSFEPIGEPHVAITKLAVGQDLEYRITLVLLPPIALPDYVAIASRTLQEKKIPEITDEEIQSSVNWLRESRTKLITVNRPAALGNRVEVDFSASHGGVALDAGESKNHPFILGESRFIPGFEASLIGMRAEEEKTFSLNVPEDYREKQIAGKKVDFRVSMKLVQERDIPPWNDDFVKMIGTSTSTQEAEKNIRESLTMEKEAREKERLRMAILEAILAKTAAELPPPLIERELDKMVGELRQSIEKMGLNFDEYLVHIKMTVDQLKHDWNKDAERRVKIALILREIGRKEGITPSGEEIQDTARKTIERLGLTEENMKTIDREGFLDYNRGIARNEKVFTFLENSS